MTPSKYLIITADDYGYSEERDDGILECYHDNGISNVSVMVNGCHVEEAIRKADAVGLPMGNISQPACSPRPLSAHQRKAIQMSFRLAD